jgi:hypothetical protein
VIWVPSAHADALTANPGGGVSVASWRRLQGGPEQPSVRPARRGHAGQLVSLRSLLRSGGEGLLQDPLGTKR